MLCVLLYLILIITRITNCDPHFFRGLQIESLHSIISSMSVCMVIINGDRGLNISFDLQWASVLLLLSNGSHSQEWSWTCIYMYISLDRRVIINRIYCECELSQQRIILYIHDELTRTPVDIRIVRLSTSCSSRIFKACVLINSVETCFEKCFETTREGQFILSLWDDSSYPAPFESEVSSCKIFSSLNQSFPEQRGSMWEVDSATAVEQSITDVLHSLTTTPATKCTYACAAPAIPYQNKTHPSNDVKERHREREILWRLFRQHCYTQHSALHTGISFFATRGITLAMCSSNSSDVSSSKSQPQIFTTSTSKSTATAATPSSEEPVSVPSHSSRDRHRLQRRSIVTDIIATAIGPDLEYLFKLHHFLVENCWLTITSMTWRSTVEEIRFHDRKSPDRGLFERAISSDVQSSSSDFIV
jgi:hypothetical protein